METCIVCGDLCRGGLPPPSSRVVGLGYTISVWVRGVSSCGDEFLCLRDTDLASLVNLGKTWAMCKLANRLEYRNPGEARLYLRAGLLGEVSAYSRLGRMYFFGRGGIQSGGGSESG